MTVKRKYELPSFKHHHNYSLTFINYYNLRLLHTVYNSDN